MSARWDDGPYAVRTRTWRHFLAFLGLWRVPGGRT